jgi:hypothetical protein
MISQNKIASNSYSQPLEKLYVVNEKKDWYILMKLSELFISINCVLLLSISGCTNNTPPPLIELPGSMFSGSIRLLREDNSIEIIRKNVSVQLVGTNLSGVTDSSGKWQISKVPKGTYTVSFRRSGYTELQRFNIVSDGKTAISLGELTLAQTPSYTVRSVQAKPDSDKELLTIDAEISSATSLNNGRRIILYFDTTNTAFINPRNYQYCTVAMTIPRNSTTGSYSLPLQNLWNAGISKKSTIYLAAYGIVRYEATPDASFISPDPQTGRSIFWNISPPAATAQFRIP